MCRHGILRITNWIIIKAAAKHSLSLFCSFTLLLVLSSGTQHSCVLLSLMISILLILWEKKTVVVNHLYFTLEIRITILLCFMHFLLYSDRWWWWWWGPFFYPSRKHVLFYIQKCLFNLPDSRVATINFGIQVKLAEMSMVGQKLLL